MKKNFLILFLFLTNLLFSQEKLPVVTLKNLDDKSISTDSFQEKDKLYIYSFWATWCAPCIQELDAINDVYADWQKELNVELIAVAVDDSRTQKRVKPLSNGKGWNYTILLDTNQELKRKLSIANVPYLLIVKNNQILFTQNGHVPGGEEELLTKLRSL